MKLEQHLQYLDNNYSIIAAEHEFILHPCALGILPVTTEAAGRSFACSYQVDNYDLYIKNLTLYGEGSAALGSPSDTSGDSYDYTNKKVPYNGAVLIGNSPIKEYEMKGYGSMFYSYKNVYELIFDDGFLVTTIDHGKAMLRIRKNIELGLRCLTKKRDLRCINHFMKITFIGDYRPFSSVKNRLRYLEKMKKNYKSM